MKKEVSFHSTAQVRRVRSPSFHIMVCFTWPVFLLQPFPSSLCFFSLVCYLHLSHLQAHWNRNGVFLCIFFGKHLGQILSQWIQQSNNTGIFLHRVSSLDSSSKTFCTAFSDYHTVMLRDRYCSPKENLIAYGSSFQTSDSEAVLCYRYFFSWAARQCNLKPFKRNLYP